MSSLPSSEKMFAAGAGYDRFMGRWSRLLATPYIAFAAARDGDRLLDVGCGTGALAGALAQALPSSEIVGIDPSAGFVGHASAQAPSARVRFEVGDAQALRFADATFDQTMSLLVLNFVPDPSQAVGQMRRVTRPAGVVSACVWDYGAGMEMLRVFWDEAVAADPAAEPKDERHMKLSRAGELGALWRQIGLERTEDATLEIEQPFASFDDYWEPFLHGVGPAGAYAASLPAPRRGQLEQRLRARLCGRGSDGPFTLKARAWCVRGEVPRAG